MTRRQTLVVAAIVLGGAALRLAPIYYGLPFYFHPDETHLIRDLGKFLEALSRGETTIGTSTFYYPLTAVYGLYFLTGLIAGRFESLADFKMAVVLDDPMLHVLGRAMAVAFSVASLVVVYVLGRRLYGHRGGVIATLLMAVSVIDVSSSHWLKFDSGVMLMSMLSIAAILEVTARPPAPKAYALAGVIIGLSVAGRIDLLVLVPLLVVAHVLASRPGGIREAMRSGVDRPVLVALGTVALVYLVVSFTLINAALEYVFAAPRPFTTREMGESLIQYFMAGDMLLSLRHNVPFYVSAVLLGTCGVALTAAMVVGVVRAAASRRRDELIVLAFVALVVAPMLVFNVYGTHYFLRVLPALIVLSAGGIVWVLERLGPRAGGYASAVVVTLIAAQPAYFSAEYVHYLLTNIDTRTRAREWLYEQVTFGDVIAVQKFHELPAYLPPIKETPQQIRRKLEIVQADGRSSGIAFAAQLDQPLDDSYHVVNLSASSFWSAGGSALENLYDFDGLKSTGVKYVVTSAYNTLLPVNDDGGPIGVLIAPRSVDPRQVARYDTFNRRLREEAMLVAEFTARDPRVARRTDAPVDPTVRVYRLH